MKRDLVSNIEDINKEIEKIDVGIKIFSQVADKVGENSKTFVHAMDQLSKKYHQRGCLEHQKSLLITLLDIRRLSAISDTTIREF